MSDSPVEKKIYQTQFGTYSAPTIISNTAATSVNGVAIQAVSNNVVIASMVGNI